MHATESSAKPSCKSRVNSNWLKSRGKILKMLQFPAICEKICSVNKLYWNFCSWKDLTKSDRFQPFFFSSFCKAYLDELEYCTKYKYKFMLQYLIYKISILCLNILGKLMKNLQSSSPCFFPSFFCLRVEIICTVVSITALAADWFTVVCFWSQSGLKWYFLFFLITI